jgi:hypothetical protein
MIREGGARKEGKVEILSNKRKDVRQGECGERNSVI